MSKDEFIKQYCENSGVEWNWLQQYQVALPCMCGSSKCKGWAMVPNDIDSIKKHMELYAPKDSVKKEIEEGSNE